METPHQATESDPAPVIAPESTPRAESPAPAASRSALDSTTLDPEVLARLVVQVREFRLSLERIAPQLPPREDTPFLYKQLEDALSRLVGTIHGLGTSPLGSPPAHAEPASTAPAKSERRGLLGLFTRRKKETPEPTPPSQPADGQGVDLQGTSWTIPVPELLSFLSLSHKTGMLWIHTPQETFMLEMRGGRLVKATSDRTPPGLRIGDFLAGMGRIPREDVDGLVRAAQEAKEPLGAHLVRIGRISAQELQEALGIQVQSLFHRLITSENAVYRFQEGHNVSVGSDIELNVTSLLLESARFHDERSAPQSPADAAAA
jgi:hypothetical protein